MVIPAAEIEEPVELIQLKKDQTLDFFLFYANAGADQLQLQVMKPQWQQAEDPNFGPAITGHIIDVDPPNGDFQNRLKIGDFVELPYTGASQPNAIFRVYRITLSRLDLDTQGVNLFKLSWPDEGPGSQEIQVDVVVDDAAHILFCKNVPNSPVPRSSPFELP